MQSRYEAIRESYKVTLEQIAALRAYVQTPEVRRKINERFRLCEIKRRALRNHKQLSMQQSLRLAIFGY